MDILRVKNKRKVEEFIDRYTEETENLFASISQLNESIGLKQELEKVIDELSEIERIILVMHYWEGFSIREISDQLDLGLSAVKMKLMRTRDKMKQSLNEKGYDHYLELSIFLILFLI